MATRRNERVKAWLWGYRDAVREQRRLSEEFRQLIESQEGPKAIRYDGESGTGSAEGTDLSALMVARERLQSRLESSKLRTTKAFTERSEAIQRLSSGAMREVISMRYILIGDGHATRWTDIAAGIGYSEQYVLDLHGRALDELSKILENERPE